MTQPILVVSALPQELEPLARRLMAARMRSTVGLAAWQATLSARTVVLVATGCGSGPTTTALSRLIAELRPACVVATGICGALVPGPRTGHLVLAEAVRREGETTPREATARLLAPAASALSESAVPVHRGLMVSGHRVVCSAGEKGRLAAETGGVAVDMESGWVAEEADRAGVPWLAVRAVMDEVDRPPAMDYGQFVRTDGRVGTLGIVLHALVRPWLWSALSEDGARTKEATASLSRALTRLLSALGAVV